MAKSKIDDLRKLNLNSLLEETLACGRIGRTLASYGSILTAREKQGVKLIYLLLKSGESLSKRTPATAKISEDTISKKYDYANAVKWFAEIYPEQAKPLLAKLKEKYEKNETSVMYGPLEGKDLKESYYIDIISNLLNINNREASFLYRKIILPELKKTEEEKGLLKVVMR